MFLDHDCEEVSEWAGAGRVKYPSFVPTTKGIISTTLRLEEKIENLSLG
jgi:hypothetical protein